MSATNRQSSLCHEGGLYMSRKTSRNGSKNAMKKGARLAGLGRAAYGNLGLSGLALGSLSLGIGGVAHAQSAPTGKRSDQPAAPGCIGDATRRTAHRSKQGSEPRAPGGEHRAAALSVRGHSGRDRIEAGNAGPPGPDPRSVYRTL